MPRPHRGKRSSRRIRWDRVLGRALAERGPAGLKVETEIELFRTPPRLDHALLLQATLQDDAEEPTILRDFWPEAPPTNVTELKTVTGPYVERDLFRLDAKTSLYFPDKCEGLDDPAELGMVLMVPGMNPALATDLRRKRWKLETYARGYSRIGGCGYSGFLIFLDEVADSEQDDLIRCVSRHKIEDASTADWLVTTGGVPEYLAMANISGFTKRFVTKALTDKRLMGEAMEDPVIRAALLARIPAERRLEDLSTEGAILALPPAALRLFPKEALARLSPTTRRKIARKLADRRES